MISGLDFVWFLPPPWDGVWTRQQHFSSILAENSNRVLYVERPVSILTKLRSRYTVKQKWSATLRRIKPGLFVLTPPPVLPFSAYLAATNALNVRFAVQVTQRYLHKLGFRKPILWVRIPKLAPNPGSFSERILVYDCTDEYSDFKRQNRKLMASKERKVLKRADLVLVTARSLLTKRLAFNENTHFVSNGVDYALFANAHHVKGKLPDRLRNLPRPIAGFMGLITYWLDEDLLHRFCQAWSGSVVFIGPCENQDIVTSLSSNRNFHYLGAVPRRSDLIPYVGNFDVCLVPFKRTDLTTRMNPLKVYEYLAAGKPVVSVDLPELRELQDVVALATSESEFIRQAEAAVKHDSETAVQRRMAVARMYSWESLVEDVSLLIEKTLALKKNR